MKNRVERFHPEIADKVEQYAEALCYLVFHPEDFCDLTWGVFKKPNGDEFEDWGYTQSIVQSSRYLK